MIVDYSMPGGKLRRVRDLVEEKCPLLAIDFLHRNGKAGARGNKVHTVRLTFDNKEVIRMSMLEFDMLSDVTFTLKERQGV